MTTLPLCEKGVSRDGLPSLRSSWLDEAIGEDGSLCRWQRSSALVDAAAGLAGKQRFPLGRYNDDVGLAPRKPECLPPVGTTLREPPSVTGNEDDE